MSDATTPETERTTKMGKILWCHDTKNFASGCSEDILDDGTMDPACVHCYARIMSSRCAAMGQPIYDDVSSRTGNVARWTGQLRVDLDMMDLRFREMRGGRITFIGSMTDLWHPDHDPQLLVRLAQNLRALGDRPLKRRPLVVTLTKREDRLLSWQREHFPDGLPPWHYVGVTAGCQRSWDQRVPVLAEVKALGPRVVSVEPITGPIIPSHVDQLGWVIVGGESGQKARPMHPKWATDLRDQCVNAGVPYFFKQWGEWKPITQMTEEEMNAPYRSNRVAKDGEDQAELDEFYGKTCTVPELVIRDNGEHRSFGDPLAFNSDAPGGNFMHAFRVGKAKAGRLLDGVEHSNFPPPIF